MKDKVVFFYMDEDLKKELDILSKREGRSLKSILNEQVESYIKTHKDGNPQHLMTNFLENEDFMGFPSISINLENKKKYAKKMDKKMINELSWHIQEWETVLKKI